MLQPRRLIKQLFSGKPERNNRKKKEKKEKKTTSSVVYFLKSSFGLEYGQGHENWHMNGYKRSQPHDIKLERLP